MKTIEPHSEENAEAEKDEWKTPTKTAARRKIQVCEMMQMQRKNHFEALAEEHNKQWPSVAEMRPKIENKLKTFHKDKMSRVTRWRKLEHSARNTCDYDE